MFVKQRTGGSHILATPEECSPQTKTFLFLPKIEFQLNNGHYYDIPFFKTTVSSFYRLILLNSILFVIL